MHRYIDYYASPLIGGALSDAFVWCLSVAYIGPKSRTGRPRKTKIGTEIAMSHVTRTPLSRSKGQRSTGTYSAWESTAMLGLLGGARGAGAPTEGWEGRGHIAHIYSYTIFLLIWWHSIPYSKQLRRERYSSNDHGNNSILVLNGVIARYPPSLLWLVHRCTRSCGGRRACRKQVFKNFSCYNSVVRSNFSRTELKSKIVVVG